MAGPRLSEINLNLLSALDALLAEKNVTRAAARVGVTQSAMSHSLRHLRELLDDPLLVRGASGMVPTPRAEELAGPVRRALAELSRALQGGAGYDPKAARRTFTIAMGDIFTLLVLPVMLEMIGREAPGVDVIVRPPDVRRDFDLLETGELDVTLAVVVDDRADLRSRRLMSDGFACLARVDHPEVRGSLPLDLYARLPHALISPQGAGSSVVDAALERHGLTRRVALRVPYFLAAPLVIVRSDLILTAPRRIAEFFAESYPLQLLEPPVEVPGFTAVALWHERYDRDPGHAWLREVLVRAAAVVEQRGR